jgi:ribosomal protein L21E
MARYNIGDKVLISEGTEALKKYQGKTGTIEASSEQYFGAVYEVRLDDGGELANSLNEDWIQAAK